MSPLSDLLSLKAYVGARPFVEAADDRLAEGLCWVLVLTQLAVLLHDANGRGVGVRR